MKIFLLIVANKSKWASFDKKIKDLKDFFAPKVELIVELKHTEFSGIPFSSYGERLLGVNRKWYDDNITPMAVGYDTVLFLVDGAQWPSTAARGWRTDMEQGPVELQVSAREEEYISYQENGQTIHSDAFYQFSRHEILHALFMLSGQTDTVHYWWDKSPSLLNKALDDVKLEGLYTQGFIKWALGILAKLSVKLPMTTPKIEKWAEAIKTHEGWFKGSRSQRNNNPGNFRFYPAGYRDIYGVVKEDRLGVAANQRGYALFKDYDTGWLYLKNFLTNAATGKSSTYSPTMNLYEFFAVYAPSGDKNNPQKYAEVVASSIGVSVTTKIKDLV